MLEIFLMRHGDAEKGKAGQPDASRRLTALGKREVEMTARRAANGGLDAELIFSSPYIRALETASTVRETLGATGGIVISDALTPDGSPDEVWTEIRGLGANARVLLTSHEPLVGRLAGFLLRSDELSVIVRTGSILRIDVESSGARPLGHLRWMITPKIS